MTILVVFGTRPEAIKLAPVIKELARQGISHKVCITSQHHEMLAPFLKLFDVRVDYDLGIMKPDQDLYHITTEVLEKLRGVLQTERPAVVVVQGDTTTALAAALAAFYSKIPVAHVEAGLRTGCRYSPFPEEMNRCLIDHLSELLFAPTERSRQNLLAEGISTEKMIVTGNTIVDALLAITSDARFQRLEPPALIPIKRRLILVTAHRRESFSKLSNICQALRHIAENNEDVEIVYPVHLNPNVREPVHRFLDGVKHVHLVNPLEYLPFLKLMQQAYLILTDSGGIQEEAPTLAKPVLVMRDITERPEGIDVGVAKLVGTKAERIIQETQRLLEDTSQYQKMVSGINPYGDGQAAERIVCALRDFIHFEARLE